MPAEVGIQDNKGREGGRGRGLIEHPRWYIWVEFNVLVGECNVEEQIWVWSRGEDAVEGYTSSTRQVCVERILRWCKRSIGRRERGDGIAGGRGGGEDNVFREVDVLSRHCCIAVLCAGAGGAGISESRDALITILNWKWFACFSHN